MRKHWTDEASFSDFIISHLLSCRSLTIQKKVLYELVQKRRALDNRSFNNNLYRLKNKGILNFDSNKNIIINRIRLRKHVLFQNILEKPAGNLKIMVLFDIPESKRKVRNWLRHQLKLWDFKMIQQSVWLGEGPLPAEFSQRLKLLGVKEGVKILKVQSIKI